MGPVDKCCSQIKPVPPSHRPFIFINHSDNGQSFWRLECSKAFKLHLLEDYVRNTQLSSKYNNHIRIMTYFRTNIKKIFLRKCSSKCFFAWDLLISAVARSSRFLPPIDHLFLSIIVIMDNLFGDQNVEKRSNITSQKTT